jgi:cold shock CspA family protein
MQGIVKRVCNDRDSMFGFIAPDDGSDDVFFHSRDFTRAGMAPPQARDRVQFDIVDTPKGRKVSLDRLRIVVDE